jgi:hypothetical protein
MAPQWQEVAAIAGDDQFDFRRDGGGEHVVIVGVAWHDARHVGRRNQSHERRVMRCQCVGAGGVQRDAGASLG